MAKPSAYEWDEAKRAANARLHGVDFSAAEALDWKVALTIDQTRDGERRHASFAPIHGQLHCPVWTARGAKVPIISLRRANDRERRAYEQAIDLD